MISEGGWGFQTPPLFPGPQIRSRRTW